MLTIDGSYGEGGGQILRTAVALSTLTNTAIKINNIRANRSNPGLRPQHFMAIKIMKKLCNAKVEGLEIGSSKIRFIPDEIKPGEYSFDIGTAGSINLVFQTCILGSIKSEESIKINLSGGTDVRWSPPWDYFKEVFLSLLEKMNIKVETKLIRRGHYPKGGGEANIDIKPCKKLEPFQVTEKQFFPKVKGRVHIANLPSHISERMKHAVIKKLIEKNVKSYIEVDKASSFSAGTGVTLWSRSEETVLGSSILGKKGIPAENIGGQAAERLLKDLRAQATLDIFAFDQLLPYMALAADAKYSSSCLVRNISSHASTNMWLIKNFLDVDFQVDRNKQNVKICIV